MPPKRKTHSAESFKSDFLTRLAAAELRDEASETLKLVESAQALDAMLFHGPSTEEEEELSGVVGVIGEGGYQLPSDDEVRRVAALFWEPVAQARQRNRSAYGSVTQVEGKLLTIEKGTRLEFSTWLKLCALVTRPPAAGKEHTTLQQEGWAAAFRAMDPDDTGEISGEMVQAYLVQRAAKAAAIKAADERPNKTPSTPNKAAGALEADGRPRGGLVLADAKAHRGSVVLSMLDGTAGSKPSMGVTQERAVAARAQLQANLDSHLLHRRRTDAAIHALGESSRASVPLHAYFALVHAFAPPIYHCEHASLWLLRRPRVSVAAVKSRKRVELFHWPLGADTNEAAAAAAATDSLPADDLALAANDSSFPGAALALLQPQIYGDARIDPRSDVELDRQLMGEGMRSKSVLCVPIFGDTPLRTGHVYRLLGSAVGAELHIDADFDDLDDLEAAETPEEGEGNGGGSFKQRVVDGLSASFKKLRAQGKLAGFMTTGARTEELYHTHDRANKRGGALEDVLHAGGTAGRRGRAIGVLMLVNKRAASDGRGALVPPFTPADVKAGEEFVGELGRTVGAALQAHVDAFAEQRARMEEATQSVRTTRPNEQPRKLAAGRRSVLGMANDKPVSAGGRKHRRRHDKVG